MTTITQTVTPLDTPPSRLDPTNFRQRADTYHGELPPMVTQLNTLAGQINTVAGEAANNATTATTQAGAANNSANAAATSASSALNAPGTTATSTTSIAVGTGAKTITVQTALAFAVGQGVVIADSANPATNWMWGQVTAYNSINGSLTVQVTDIAGSGTIAAWTVSLSASPRGASNYQLFYDSGATNALNIANGVHQRWAPNTGAQTLTVTGWPPAGTLGEFLIEGVNLGAATITWPTINWIKPDGSTTTTFTSNGITLQASGTDWVFLWSRDGGATIYGRVLR